MADDSTTTIRATFETREAADLAVEHLVQQHGISRPDIFIQSASERNTAGSAPSGGDALMGMEPVATHRSKARSRFRRISHPVRSPPSSAVSEMPALSRYRPVERNGGRRRMRK